jgi:hypothetical protein
MVKRTTVRLDEHLLDQAKREAHRRGETLTSLIEKGIRRELANAQNGKRPWVKLPVGHASGPLPPGLDLNSNASIQEFLDEGVPFHKLR